MTDIENKPVGMWEWILTFIISSLPIVGFIMIIVWAFGDNTKPSKKNWARAVLLFGIIVFVLYIAIFIFAIGSMDSLENFFENLPR